MESQLGIAQVAVEEGKASEVEDSVRNLKEKFHRDKAADDELEAVTVLVQALLTEGKDSDAQKEIDASQSFAQKNQNRLLRLRFELVAAQALFASDHPESARSRLEGILKEARAHDFVSVGLEAQLAVAQMEKKLGHAGAAQAQLIILERIAREKGFGLIARKASDARRAVAKGNAQGSRLLV